MLFIIYFLIQPLLEAMAEIKNIFVCFLVQMKSLEFAFEIKLPLAKVINTTNNYFKIPYLDVERNVGRLWLKTVGQVHLLHLH